jgi:hypothetical protein
MPPTQLPDHESKTGSGIVEKLWKGRSTKGKVGVVAGAFIVFSVVMSALGDTDAEGELAPSTTTASSTTAVSVPTTTPTITTVPSATAGSVTATTVASVTTAVPSTIAALSTPVASSTTGAPVASVAPSTTGAPVASVAPSTTLPTVAPSTTVAPTTTVTLTKFANCEEMNKVYPGGVAKVGVTGDMVSGELKPFVFNRCLTQLFTRPIRLVTVTGTESPAKSASHPTSAHRRTLLRFVK